MPLRIWTNDDWENREKLLQAFNAHYKHVREIVPKENLLEWTVSDGWEPTCKFPGKPVPDEPFPYINKGMAASDLHLMLGRIGAAQMLWGGEVADSALPGGFCGVEIYSVDVAKSLQHIPLRSPWSEQQNWQLSDHLAFA